MNYQIDIDYGQIAEKKAIILLQEYFKFSLVKLDYYNSFDFYNEQENVYIELKSRHCQVNTYKSTMVGMNKINKARLLNRKNFSVYFFFYFTNSNNSTHSSLYESFILFGDTIES